MRDKGFLPTFESGRSRFWAPSSLHIVYSLFKELSLDRYSSFLDLGCGDGRVVLLASLFTNACGFETNRYLLNIGKRVRKKFSLDAGLYADDFRDASLSDFDFIFWFPDRDFNNSGFLHRLKKEFSGTLVTYKTYPLSLPGIPKKKFVVEGVPLYIYDFDTR